MANPSPIFTRDSLIGKKNEPRWTGPTLKSDDSEMDKKIGEEHPSLFPDVVFISMPWIDISYTLDLLSKMFVRSIQCKGNPEQMKSVQCDVLDSDI